MKQLADGTKVVSRMYYYLLDFNDMTNWDYIRNTFQKNALRDLNKAEFIKRSVKPTDAVGSVGCKRPLTLGENILTYGFW